MKSQENQDSENYFADLLKRMRRLGVASQISDGSPVSPAQMALIDWIASNPGCGVQDIANGLSLTPPTVSISVRKMEGNGIVDRKPDPADARSVQFSLTKQGQIIYKRHKLRQKNIAKELLSGLSQSERDTLIELLDRALLSAENRLSKE